MRRVSFHDVVAERHSKFFTHMLESAVSPDVLVQLGGREEIDEV